MREYIAARLGFVRRRSGYGKGSHMHIRKSVLGLLRVAALLAGALIAVPGNATLVTGTFSGVARGDTFDPRQVDIDASFAEFSGDIRSYGAV